MAREDIRNIQHLQQLLMPLIFHYWGVRSGKSHFAEKAAVTHYQTEFNQVHRLIYIASG